MSSYIRLSTCLGSYKISNILLFLQDYGQLFISLYTNIFIAFKLSLIIFSPIREIGISNLFANNFLRDIVGVREMKEYLKKSPNGYYVLVLNEEELNTIKRLLAESYAMIEEIGVGKYMVKVKSRRTYMRMLRRLGVN